MYSLTHGLGEEPDLQNLLKQGQIEGHLNHWRYCVGRADAVTEKVGPIVALFNQWDSKHANSTRDRWPLKYSSNMNCLCTS